MITVNLVNWSEKDPIEAISHAARVCYQGTAPEWGKTIDIKGRLFETGHHTTFQHVFCTFNIEGIAVGDVTFGLHLASPFYNSSQRSGRFCAGMFTNPDFELLASYVKNYWPEVEGEVLINVLEYLKDSIDVYRSNIEKAAERAKKFIREERPNANDKYLEQNGPKIAQEQLRVFVPIIFPTALEFTVNLSVLAALYRSAWSPVMKDVTEKMVGLVLRKWPGLDFMFERQENPGFLFPAVRGYVGLERVVKKPYIKLISSGEFNSFVRPETEDLHPIDLLHFSPWLMDNNTSAIETHIEISIATMGQDQRHRTVRRSQPYFTGGFYLPPIPDSLGLEKEAMQLMERWHFLIMKKIPPTLAHILAPYGAMVGYKRSASYNAAIHELGKRLCWCAQEEIYHLAHTLRRQLKKHPIVNVMSPNCVLTGKCGEGVRYCGRDLTRLKNDPFPERKV